MDCNPCLMSHRYGLLAIAQANVEVFTLVSGNLTLFTLLFQPNFDGLTVVQNLQDSRLAMSKVSLKRVSGVATVFAAEPLAG